MSPTRLQYNKTFQILAAAEKGRYGILAAIAYNIEHILGFVKAAEAKRSPLIIQLFPWAITFSNGLLVHAAAKAASQSTVPIAVHLDHCQDEDLVKQAADLPFDSIMIDMSHHPKAENLAKTTELVAYCHARGKTTEAEPGRIEGGEDGISDTVDLHGVNRFPPELTRKLIAAGITKINVNRDILKNYYSHLEGKINRIPFTQLLEEGVEIVAQSMGRHMDVVLSSGKA